MSHYESNVYKLIYYIKAWNKVYNQIHMQTLTLIRIGRACEVFHNNLIFFTPAKPYVTR